MRNYRTVMLSLALLLALAGCGGTSDDEPPALPTRFELPELLSDPTPDTEDTPHPEIIPEITPEPVAETIPVATPTSAARPRNLGVGVVLNSFADLQAGDEVTLGGTLALVEEGAFLLDEDERRIQLLVEPDDLAALGDTFIAISGVLEASEDGLALRPFEPTPTPGVPAIDEADPLGGGVAALEFELAPAMTALRAYDALLPLIADSLDGRELVLVSGNDQDGWSFEFYRQGDIVVHRYRALIDGTVRAETNARLSLPPESAVHPIDRETIRLDSDDVYNRVDLTDLPGFVVPLLQLSAPEPDRVEWTVTELSPPVVLDATGAQELENAP
jgi:hypothetical protein